MKSGKSIVLVLALAVVIYGVYSIFLSSPKMEFSHQGFERLTPRTGGILIDSRGGVHVVFSNYAGADIEVSKGVKITYLDTGKQCGNVAVISKEDPVGPGKLFEIKSSDCPKSEKGEFRSVRIELSYQKFLEETVVTHILNGTITGPVE